MALELPLLSCVRASRAADCLQRSGCKASRAETHRVLENDEDGPCWCFDSQRGEPRGQPCNGPRPVDESKMLSQSSTVPDLHCRCLPRAFLLQPLPEGSGSLHRVIGPLGAFVGVCDGLNCVAAYRLLKPPRGSSLSAVTCLPPCRNRWLEQRPRSLRVMKERSIRTCTCAILSW
jgi:hypothetical protein